MNLNGKKIAKKITQKLIKEVSYFKIPPKMIIVQVGNNIASSKYIDFKLKKAKTIGIIIEVLKLDSNVTQIYLTKLINQNLVHCDGMIIQLPLPKHIDKHYILNQIPFEKDIDGLAMGNNIFTPATPKGIVELLIQNNIKLKNKQVAVIGQSLLVGKPVADLCEKLGAHVFRYSKTNGIKGTEKADILIVAAGVPKLVKAHNVKKNAIIIDVGINEIADKNAMTKIIGDVDRKSVITKTKNISPVPGGVGPMTIISLMTNLIDIYKKKNFKT